MRRRLTCVLLVYLAVGWRAGGASPSRLFSQSPDPLSLHAGERREGALAAGQSEVFQLELAAGDFVEAIVEPRGVDVSVTLVAPGGAPVATSDTTTDPHMAETLLAIAESAGSYRIQLTSPGPKDAAGRFAIGVSSVRAATPTDRVRVSAMRQFEDATRILKQPEAGYRERAAAAFDRAIAGFREAGDLAREARAETQAAANLGAALHRTALDRAERAVALCRRLPVNWCLGTALNVLGVTLSFQDGHVDAAVKAVEEAIAIAKDAGIPRDEASGRLSVGLIYGRGGNPERAVEELRAGLELSRTARWQVGEARALNNLGIAAKDLGDFEASANYYSQTLSLARSMDDKSLEANVLNNLGNLYRLLGDYTRARESHEQALTLARRIGNQEHEARALNTLGWTYYRLGDFRRALEHYSQALAIRRRMRDAVSLASTLDGLGMASHALGEDENALSYIDEGLRLRRSMAHPAGETESLSHRAQVKRDRNDLRGALEDLTAAIEVSDSVRGRIMSPDSRATFAGAEQQLYDLYIDVLMQLDSQSPGGHFAARALEASEQGRARVLLETLLGGRTDIREGIDPALLSAEKALQKRFDDASTTLSRLLARGSSSQELDTARGALDTLNGEYKALEARIRKESPKYAALTQPRALSLREIQRDLLDPDTLLLEFRLGEKQSWLWCVTTTSLHSFALPPRATIEQAGREIYELLTARQPRRGETPSARSARVARADAQWRGASRSFSRMLLGKVASEMAAGWNGKRLVIVASDVLEYLPFAALPDPADFRRPLVHGHEIVNAPSASVVAVIRQESAGRPEPARQLAVLADPVFEADDPRVIAGERVARPQPARAVAWPATVSKGTPVFARLPFSREEARAIASLVPASDRLEATGFEANRALATSEALADYRFVHFATHGVLDAERPELSGLVLSLVGNDGRAENGFLRTRDIYNLRLPADLVVLSACQTALGKQIRGEGFVGLTRGFMYAGARRVVATLWQVDDLATAELMRLFYRGMLQQGLSPAAALRSAQKQMAARPQWSSPFYWSSVVLQGEWR
jgi:CHAT domain-containing protein/tetratricopeptide (TPR) repeat protein